MHMHGCVHAVLVFELEMRTRDMRTSSESRMQTALLSCAPPVIIHAAPTASPRATCVRSMATELQPCCAPQ